MQIRAEFIAQAFDLQTSDVLARLQGEYSRLERVDAYERVVLWFEHDSYDQLILAYVLARLRRLRPRARLELVAVDAVPGVRRFIGIGQLAPDVLAWLWTRRRPVTEAQLELGEHAWAAVTAPSPERLDALCHSETPALPMLGRALRRHLQELPDLRSGLGLTDTLVLEIVRDLEPAPVGKVYSQLMREREPLPYLGDLMYWWQVQTLTRGREPLVAVEEISRAWPDRLLSLTEVGRAVLAGKRNWLTLEPPPRWVGGVRVPSELGCWCYDHGAERIAWRAAFD